MTKYLNALLISLCMCCIAFAQTSSSNFAPVRLAVTNSIADKLNSAEAAIKYHQQTIAFLEKDLERLREHSTEVERISSTTMTWTTWALAVIAIVFALGTISSYYQINKARSEAKELIKSETDKLIKKAETDIASDLKVKLEASDSQINYIKSLLETTKNIKN